MGLLNGCGKRIGFARVKILSCYLVCKRQCKVNKGKIGNQVPKLWLTPTLLIGESGHGLGQAVQTSRIEGL